LPQNPRFQSLDRVDCSIIRELQIDGRASYAKIGKGIGLSATSVAERIRRLEESGVVEGYGARLSAGKLGYPITTFILSRPTGPDAAFIKLAKSRGEILECHRVTGEFSFVCRAVVRDVKHLEELLNYLEPGAVQIVTLIVLSTSFDAVPVCVDDNQQLEK
jgi:Lrp/AsnC family leucine-responsive transcriptional regulator